MQHNDDFSPHVRRALTVLETVSGSGSLIVTPQAIGAATQAVANIEGLSDESKVFIMHAAIQLAETMLKDPMDPNYTNQCRGMVVRNGVTQQVVHTISGEC